MSQRLSATQIASLWVKAGGDPSKARTAAAIALAESGGRVNALNKRPPDYSVGLWQINYYGNLRPARTRQFGSPQKLRSDPLANARAAVRISGNGKDFSPWTTYTSGAYENSPVEGVPSTLSAGSFGNAPPSPATPSAPTLPPSALPSIGSLQSNLGKIASGGFEPTDLLADTSNTMLSQLLNPSKLRHSSLGTVQAPSFDLRGHPTTQASKALDPGGGWGGSYAPATQVAKVGERFGLTPTSEKRDRQMTASGNTSDHWVGSKNAYAYDLGGSVGQMDKAARAITRRLGIPYKGGPLVATVTRNGLRYQVLYRTNVGGNHFNHIHVGVKRVG